MSADGVPPAPEGFTQWVLNDPEEERAIEDLTRRLVDECSKEIPGVVDLNKMTDDEKRAAARIFVAGMRASMFGGLLMNLTPEGAAASIHATIPGMIEGARARALARRAKN